MRWVSSIHMGGGGKGAGKRGRGAGEAAGSKGDGDSKRAVSVGRQRQRCDRKRGTRKQGGRCAGQLPTSTPCALPPAPPPPPPASGPSPLMRMLYFSWYSSTSFCLASSCLAYVVTSYTRRVGRAGGGARGEGGAVGALAWTAQAPPTTRTLRSVGAQSCIRCNATPLLLGRHTQPHRGPPALTADSWSRLLLTAGSTSPTLRSTSTSPTWRRHARKQGVTASEVGWARWEIDAFSQRGTATATTQEGTMQDASTATATKQPSRTSPATHEHRKIKHRVLRPPAILTRRKHLRPGSSGSSVLITRSCSAILACWSICALVSWSRSCRILGRVGGRWAMGGRRWAAVAGGGRSGGGRGGIGQRLALLQSCHASIRRPYSLLEARHDLLVRRLAAHLAAVAGGRCCATRAVPCARRSRAPVCSSNRCWGADGSPSGGASGDRVGRRAGCSKVSLAVN